MFLVLMYEFGIDYVIKNTFLIIPKCIYSYVYIKNITVNINCKGQQNKVCLFDALKCFLHVDLAVVAQNTQIFLNKCVNEF